MVHKERDNDVISWIVNVASSFRSNQTGIPSAVEFWKDLDTVHNVLQWSSFLASTAVIGLALFQLSFVVMYTSSEHIRSNMYFLIFMAPITCICSLIGLFIPRSAAFLYAVNLSYYMLCLSLIIKLMFSMFGSRRLLQKYIEQNQIRIKLAVPPFFGCCKCLPTFEGSPRNMIICESLIIQTVIIRIILQVGEIIVFFELGNREHVFFTCSHIIGLVSMFIAFYFVYVMIDIGRDRLTPYRFAALFRIVDIAQTLGSLQKFVIDFLVAVNFIHGNELMSPNSAGQFYLGCALTWEMLLLSLIATYRLRPSKSLIFDQYPVQKSSRYRHRKVSRLNSTEHDTPPDGYLTPPSKSFRSPSPKTKALLSSNDVTIPISATQASHGSERSPAATPCLVSEATQEASAETLSTSVTQRS